MLLQSVFAAGAPNSAAAARCTHTLVTSMLLGDWRANIEAFEGANVDYVCTNAAGAAMMKDYGTCWRRTRMERARRRSRHEFVM